MNVYCITFPNKKRYVGVESKTGTRRRSHKCAKGKQVVHRQIRKYGWENCKFEYLYTDLLDKDAFAKEIELIAAWNLQNYSNGYNMSSGGDTSNKGMKLNAEQLKRHSEVRLGKNLGSWGRHTEETKRKMSIAKTGKPLKSGLTPEGRKRIGEKNKAHLTGRVGANLGKKFGPSFKRRKIICLDTGKIYTHAKDVAGEYKVHEQTIRNICEGKSNFLKLRFKYLIDSSNLNIIRLPIWQNKVYSLVILQQ